MPQSRSPSPSAAPPTITAPGPRASALQNGFQKALEAILTKCDYNNFSACFPTAAQYAPSALRDFHRDFASKLGEVARSEFEGILAERTVVKGLNELDELLKEAKERKAEAERKATQEGGEVAIPTA
jgi:kinetochore protein NNF1